MSDDIKNLKNTPRPTGVPHGLPPSYRGRGGFTIVELMLAMAIFSFVLVIMVSSIVRLIHFYEASVNIRITQQTAREISNDLTQAAQQSYLITTLNTVTTDPSHGFGTQPESAVCFFAGTSKRLDTNDIIGEGVVYYAHPTDATNNLWIVQEASFTNMQTALTGTTTCGTPASPNGAAFGSVNQASPSNASLVRFSATSSTDGRLGTFDMVIAGTTEISPADITYPAAGAPASQVPECVGGEDNRYCSITRLMVSAEAREVIQS